ncbi:MAG TPA: hypothetical protein VF690_20840 [Hymenobacter sp.]|jgi:hypothetical protein
MKRDRILLDDLRFREVVVPEWERRFGVRFAQDAFAQARTVGAVLAMVRQQVPVHGRPAGAPFCSSTRLFYRLRRALQADGFPRERLTPRTRLTTLFPWRTRARQWARLQQTSGLSLPALHLPAAAFAGAWLGVTASTWPLFPAPAGFAAVLCGLNAALVLGDRSWAKLAFPVTTLGELMHHVLARHYHVIQGGPFYWREVRAIVLAGLLSCQEESTAVGPGELTTQTRLEW